MKTTLDLPHDLLVAAKSAAARRRTTLKALVEHALRREIQPAAGSGNPDPSKYVVGPFGILSIKGDGSSSSVEQMRHIIEHQHVEEDTQVITGAEGRP